MINITSGQTLSKPRHDFSTTPDISRPRSSFNRSFRNRGTFNVGYLVPIFTDIAFPGDTMNVKTKILARFQPMLYPIMDNVWLDTFYFAIPFRILFKNWERMNGFQPSPGDSTDFLIPQIIMPGEETLGFAPQSFWDYIGIPIGVGSEDANPSTSAWTFSALFGRGYHKTWNDWFRDQNINGSVYFTDGDGPDDWNEYQLLRTNSRHDYFTAMLPYAQKGPAVSLPIGGDLPVYGRALDPDAVVQGDIVLQMLLGSPPEPHPFKSWVGASDGVFKTGATGENQFWNIVNKENSVGANTTTVYADASAMLAPTINAMRTAIAYQQILELDARGGTRYQEKVLAFFGVQSSDSRMQRSEYLNGTYGIMMNTTVVPQTSESGSTPKASLGAAGTINDDSSGFIKSFEEHCVVMGFMRARVDRSYQQGLDRMFSYKTINDFYVPQLANLGEQPVYQRELYVQALKGTDPSPYNNRVIGFIPRWDEMRSKQSLITGFLRSAAYDSAGNPASLDAYHLAQFYSESPNLSPEFIAENPPMGRVKVVPGTEEDPTPDFEYDIWHTYNHVRVMPLVSNPGLLRF